MNALLAASQVGYVVAGWAGTLGALGLYGFSVVRRGRRLSRFVPPDERRWS